MNILTRDTVQHHCRTCLTNLERKVNEIGLPGLWYHVETTENLSNWINNLTSLHVQSKSNEYPQFVCQNCYEKFKEFCNFQELVWQVAKKLDKIFTKNMLEYEPHVTIDKKVKGSMESHEKNDVTKSEQSEVGKNSNGIVEMFPANDVKINFETFDSELINSKIDDFEDSNEGSLEQFPKQSVANKTYKCGLCNRSYHHKYTYIAHIRQDHHGVTHAFECDQCHKSYTMFCNLYRHMRLEHNESLRQIKCKYPKCNRSFRHLPKLQIHYKEYHNQTEFETHIRPPTSPSPPDSTLLLPELFEPSNQLLDTPKRFKCTLCSDSFETLYNLKTHMSEHRNEMKYICNICGCRKISQLKLDEHYATVHDPKNAYPCKICHKVFKSKSHVSVHTLSVHKGLRPFACHYCPSQFAAKNTLKIHERIHTGEKPFACEICGRRFTQLTPMKKHKLTHEKVKRQQLQNAASR